MTLLLVDIKERLKRLDESYLLELLDITSEELVEMFVDRIEEKIEQLEEVVSYE
jgi:enoyl-[acyl-carrier-protein] reductase (NADH)